MTVAKQRITVTVDPAWVDAANLAVASGEADSVSAWVGKALAEQAAKDRRRKALAEAIADYEAEFGVITEEEMAEQERIDRANAVVVRGDGRRETA